MIVAFKTKSKLFTGTWLKGGSCKRFVYEGGEKMNE